MDYRQMFSNRVGAFIDQHIEPSFDSKITASDFYAAWNNFCKKKHFHPGTPLLLGRELTERGINRIRGMNGSTLYLSIKLKDEN